ncbi:MAG: RNA polymerase sigma factor region1.1 domain-containing protein [Ruminococcus sp.]
MDVIQFQEKLRNICELGKQNGNMLTHEQIREHFASTDLETSQMLKVLQYLKLQGIMIEGDTAPVETEEVGETEPESKGTSTLLTSEEEAYLKDYLAEVSNGKK